MKKSFNIYILSLIISLSISLQVFGQGFKASQYNICKDQTVLFTDTTSVPAGVTVAYRDWNFGNTTTRITANDTIYCTYNTQGSCIVTLKITYSNGTDITIPGPTPILISTKPTGVSIAVDKKVTCPGVLITFTPSYTAGSYASISNFDLYLGDNTPARTLMSPNSFSYSQLGSFTAKYVIKDGGGCSDSATVKVDIIPSPKPKFYTETPTCRDSISIYINDTKFKDSFVSWTWTFFDRLNPGTGLSQNGNHTWKTPGKDTVVLAGTNQYQCTGISDLLIVTVDTTPKLVISPSLDTTICFGESINYKVKGAPSIFFDNLIWGTNLSADTLYNLAPKNSMTYTVYGKTPNCPKVGTDIKISVVQPISTSISFDPDTILKGSISNTKVHINAIYDSIRWLSNYGLFCNTCDTTGASPDTSMFYLATIYYSLNNYKCSTTASKMLTVINDCVPANFAIPNAFTPNGDTKNDVFYLKGYSFRDVKSINIYTRWGNLVYSAKDIPANDDRYSWNGKEQNVGEDLPTGLYLYNIQTSCSNGQLINFQGEITLIR